MILLFSRWIQAHMRNILTGFVSFRAYQGTCRSGQEHSADRAPSIISPGPCSLPSTVRPILSLRPFAPSARSARPAPLSTESASPSKSLASLFLASSLMSATSGLDEGLRNLAQGVCNDLSQLCLGDAGRHRHSLLLILAFALARVALDDK